MKMVAESFFVVSLIKPDVCIELTFSKKKKQKKNSLFTEW